MRNAIILISFALLLFAGCAQQAGNGGQASVPGSVVGSTPGAGSGEPAAGNEAPAAPPAVENDSADPVEMGQWNLTTESVDAVNEDGQNATEKDYSGIRFGGYTLLLEDLAPQGREYCALVRIVGIEGADIMEYERAQICPGDSYYWVSPEGHEYRIYVVETAAGYSQGKIWANIIIYG
ncbi:MAG: hypothetical protein PHY95_02945 [Candidatus ainarchaeum sp.]|nr:hypothetical protein [Candidatus ainarchaeum sp.]